MSTKQDEEHWVKSQLDKAGREMMDPKPLFERIGFKRTPTLEQRLQQMLAVQRQEMREEMMIDPEEELNFDIDDDPDMVSPYEAELMIEEQIDLEKYMSDKEASPTPSDPDPEPEEGTELPT